jgi:cystathionine beta-synthase
LKTYFFTLLDTSIFGNTPLQLCSYLSDKYQCHISLKKEYFNPNKTSKDRAAWYMVKDAIAKQRLKPNDTIVEASSGNTGIGIAYLAKQLGYRSCIFVTKSCSKEKLALLRALAAKIVICDNSNGPLDKNSTQYQARAFTESNSNCYYTDQYNNPMNWRAHYETTGPEIWAQTAGKVTHFIAGVGTTGTVTGVGKYLKEQNQAIKVFGIEPLGSILSHYKRYGKISSLNLEMEKIEGIGRKFVPGIFNLGVVDHILQVGLAHTRQTAVDYYKRSGILTGFSSAAVLAGLENYCANNPLGKQDHVVLLFADYGDRYTNNLYSTLNLKNNTYERLS